MLICHPWSWPARISWEEMYFLVKGVEVTFTGLTDLQKSLPPDYFEITGANTASFLGKNAIYKAYYYIDGDYLIC